MIEIPLWLGVLLIYLFFEYVEPKLKELLIGSNKKLSRGTTSES